MEENSWDRQKNETQKAFNAFGLYRDLGYTRSMQKVAQMYAKETGRKEKPELGRQTTNRRPAKKATRVAKADGRVEDRELREERKRKRV